MMEYIKNIKLKHQLIIVTLIAIIFSFFSMVVLLPKLLTPFYEKNIYQLLEQPLQYIEPGQLNTDGNTAFIIYDKSGTALISNNFYEIVKIKDISKILSKVNKSNGKFRIFNQTYYYSTKTYTSQKVITITDDSYIKEQKLSLSSVIAPALIFTSIITIAILVLYSNYMVKKISKIKEKIDNIDNDKYNHKNKFDIDDELNSLLCSIEKTRISLSEKEKYKNNMFQSISHELKTPIMVITSHVEAANDDVIDKDKALEVIKEEADNLSKKVSLILQINKINYLKEDKKIHCEKTDIKPIIEKIVSKLKIVRPDLEFKITLKDTTFNGNEENWQIIIDNILSNFTRYANKKVKITVKDKKIELFNDGEKIDEGLINQIFEPYKMGTNGKHGLGLAIVKNALNLFGYNITAENKRNGVLFKIY